MSGGVAADACGVPRYWIVLAPLLLIGLLAAVLAPTLTDRSPLVGTWEAEGFVAYDSDPRSTQPVGTEFTRRWEFSERCSGGECELWLTRDARARAETAPVHGSGDKLRAVFNERTPSCRSGAPGSVTRTFDIAVTPGGKRLTAEEHTSAAFPGCGPDGYADRSSSSVRWIAVRR